ncbi:MAG TPA: hypothetical protein VEK11_00580 [Thermoanaerobaculia bacterium]|jgi:hypothetical protein|nr:hypothetical protein [Thermoanaerobaculia bacterium]
MKVTAVRNAVLTVATLFGTLTTQASVPAGTHPHPHEQSAVEYVSTAKGSFAVSPLDAKAAQARLQELKAQRPEAFRKAASVLQSRGWTPTDIVVARRIAARAEGPVQPAQTFSDGDTEIIFWSWDDGDNATWEGQIYIHNYANGGELLLDGQFQTDSSTLAVNWESEIYYKGPRTSPGASDPYVMLQRDGVRVASLGGIDVAAATNADILLVQSLRRRLQSWAECTATGCWSGALACRFTGPAWPECAAGACLAVMVGCAMQQLF